MTRVTEPSCRLPVGSVRERACGRRIGYGRRYGVAPGIRSVAVLRIFFGVVYLTNGLSKFVPGIAHLPGGRIPVQAILASLDAAEVAPQ